ncbi:hypothetical protein CC80DRAFT_31396 [Byssothecium circinans]|uniref:Uncharacterized protein n=1 Tax=Byssothecium circinans TaxID=147558 RepID=A0A6A5UBN5_9PLEO|nr:hypothetical protein CC80DRAFT_31396 [Byssothecium circinans]
MDTVYCPYGLLFTESNGVPASRTRNPKKTGRYTDRWIDGWTGVTGRGQEKSTFTILTAHSKHVRLIDKNLEGRHTTPHHTTPYHTIPHHTTPYHTIPHHTTPYHTIPHHTTLYHTIPHYTTLYHTIP